MIKIDKTSGMLLEGAEECVGQIQIGNGLKKIFIFGHMPLLYKDKPFDVNDSVFSRAQKLDDIVPYVVGQSLYILIEDGKVSEIAADYYCHSRVYYTCINGIISISEDWRKLPHTSMEIDPFQLMYFMNWDETLSGETFYTDMRFFCPTYKYVLSDGLKKRFMKFEPLDSHGYHDAVERTVKAVSMLNKKVGIMLSGGMDSTEVAVSACNIGFYPAYYCAQIQDLQMFDNIQDCAGAQAVANELGLDFKFAKCTIGSFLDGWGGELSKYVGFAYKDGKFWEAVSGTAKQEGIELLINGNSADYMHNYGYTMEDKASEKSYAHDYFMTMREVTLDEQLDLVFNKHDYSDDLIGKWKKYNNKDFSEERFLAWCMTNGNMYSGYSGVVVDEACNRMGQDIYDASLAEHMRDLMEELHDGAIRSPRQLVLEAFFIGEMNGANTRAIMGAASASGVECLIIPSSPLIYDASIKMKFQERDISIPKRESYEAIKDTHAYISAEKEKGKIRPEGLYTPSDVWRVILDVLNKEFDVEECTQKGYTLLQESGLFDIERMQNLAADDIGVRVRIAWLGYVNDIYKATWITDTE